MTIQFTNDLKHFAVTLTVRTGETEKSTQHLIKNVESEKEAIKQALLNECHCSIGEGAEWDSCNHDQIEDLWGEWVYSAVRANELTKGEVDIISNVFSI